MSATNFLIDLLSNEIFKDIVLPYAVPEIINIIKSNINNKPIEFQLLECFSNSLIDTCDSLEWEYDLEYLEEGFLLPLMDVDVLFNKKSLKRIMEEYLHHKISDNVLEKWCNNVLKNLSLDKYTHLREYFKMKCFIRADETFTTDDEIKDDCDNLVEHYEKKLFWSKKESINLCRLYVPNSYYLNNQYESYNDIEQLLKAFVNEEYHKNINVYDYPCIMFITGYPGCGKTSLVSKIAYEYRNNPNDYPAIYFIKVSNLSVYLESFEKFLAEYNFKSNKLRGAIIIIDGLDEVIKQINVNDFLFNLSDEVYSIGCKCIITCRSNLFSTENVRHCMEIKLSGFNYKEAEKWLNNYKSCDEDFDLNKWLSYIRLLDKDLCEVLLIPLILYICVERDIDISNIHSLGQLYYILFNSLDGQAATPKYKNKTIHKVKEWENLRDIAKKISILMFKKGVVTKNEIEAVSQNANDLETYFGLDFYIHGSFTQIKFVHASIWQYFFAEVIFENLILLEKNYSLDVFWENLLDIIALDKTINETILSFIVFFGEKNNWIPKSYDIYIKALMKIAFYPINKNGNIYDWISCLWREIFKIVTIIFYNYFPEMLQVFFYEISKSNENRLLLVKYSNSSNVSPITDIRQYRIVGCNLDYINLSYTNMRWTFINASSFRNANFSDAIFVGGYALDCDFTGVNFSGADLKNTDFTNSIMLGANFTNAKLYGANLSYADLERADLRRAKIEKIKLDNSNLINCLIDISQVDVISLYKVIYYNIKVYENDTLLSLEDVKKRYKELHPVKYAFWSKDILY